MTKIDTAIAEGLHAAMAKAFLKIEGALKDSENAAFKQGNRVSKYADLSSVVSAIKPALTENQLFFAQHTHEQLGGVCIETILYHASGEQLSFGKLFVPAGKQDAQGYGSALTYARRYSLMAAFGVCPEDDDGNAAVAASNAPITSEQVSFLKDEITRTQSDEVNFCKYLKTASLETLPAGKFDAAKAALAKKESK